MSWKNLPTNHKEMLWSGKKKYRQISNADGTISFEDKTEYTNKSESLFSSKEANQINEAINHIMNKLENGTDLYTEFQEYFNNQKQQFSSEGDTALRQLKAHLENIKQLLRDGDADRIIQEVNRLVEATASKNTQLKDDVQNLKSQFERDFGSGGNLRIQITQNERKANKALTDAQNAERVANGLSSKVSTLESKDRARESIVEDRSIRSLPSFTISSRSLNGISSPPWDKERVVRYRGYRSVSNMSSRSKVDVTFEPKTAKNVVMLETTNGGFYIYCKKEEDIVALDGVWFKETKNG